MQSSVIAKVLVPGMSNSTSDNAIVFCGSVKVFTTVTTGRSCDFTAPRSPASGNASLICTV